MDLRRRQAGAAGVVRGLEHVGDQAAHFGRGRVGDRLGDVSRSTGWPMRAILRIAMPEIWLALPPG